MTSSQPREPQPGEPNRPRPPVGRRRTLSRLPVHLYRLGLGPLFGKRLLLLIHTGRVSGRARKVVVEVPREPTPRQPQVVMSAPVPHRL
ncbi:hypothetical protein ACFXKR_09165 [Streptomyces violascens]|uniref:hypothetical protein n=1 Tax=Streptomyces violascens TaxID=67381 RepID=UPI00369F62D6